jgi:hypothetical protein
LGSPVTRRLPTISIWHERFRSTPILVWRQIVSTLVSLTGFMKINPGHAAFKAFARDRLHPLAVRLGWDAHVNEEPNAATLRQAVLAALSRFGDQPVIAEARRRFDIALRIRKEFRQPCGQPRFRS